MKEEPITNADITVARLCNMMVQRTKVPNDLTDPREAFVVAPVYWWWPHVLDPDPQGTKK